MFTLAMATYSSVTLSCSTEVEGARSHNLARSSTRSNPTGGPAPRKSTISVDLLIDASTTCRWKFDSFPGDTSVSERAL